MDLSQNIRNRPYPFTQRTNNTSETGFSMDISTKSGWLVQVQECLNKIEFDVPMEQAETKIPRQRSLSSWNLNSICRTAAVKPTKTAT